MKLYGYDSKTKCLFSWDGDFRFEGRTDVVPDGSFLVREENREWLEMAGCGFLSGNCADGYSFRVNSFDKDVVLVAGSVVADRISVQDFHPWESVVKWVNRKDSLISLCGPAVSDPVGVARFCRQFPTMRVYVCPLLDELAAFGILAMKLIEMGKEKPRRAFLCSPNEESMDGKSFEFDLKLEGDGYGVMADVVAHGVPVLNDMMKCPGVSPFYGRALARSSSSAVAYLVRCDSVNKYFPCEPISAKMYSATSVPVEFKNTSEFRKASGCELDKVNIVVVSDFILMLPVFMNFYHIMSKCDIVAIVLPENVICPKAMPVFRYRRAYSIGDANAR